MKNNKVGWANERVLKKKILHWSKAYQGSEVVLKTVSDNKKKKNDISKR